MTKYTDTLGLPYPEGGDNVAVHSDLEQLAKGVDRETGTRLLDVESTNQRLSQTIETLAYDAHTASQWFAPSPNLLNPDEFLEDHFLGGSGFVPTPLNGYTTSGFIRVIPGRTYATTARAWGVYGEDERLIVRENTNPDHEPITVTIPENGAYLRVAWASANTPTTQVEEGTQVTEYRPYGVNIPHLLADADAPPISAQVDPTTKGITIDSQLGGNPIRVTGGPHLRPGKNDVYNIGSMFYDGVNWHSTSSPDEITPLRTEAGTVGANHGFPYFQNWVNHDKTEADLGSIWTDGTREWTLVAITDAGRVHFAPDPEIPSTGEAQIPTVLNGDMVHVSGATNTATLPQSGANRGGDQVYPAVTRQKLAYYVDGIRVTEGTRTGIALEIRESYEIIDYRSLLEVARTNPGRPYGEFALDGTIRVRITYTYTGGCACVVHTELTELTPSRLGQNGFVQSGAMGGSHVERTVPGVIGWDTPVNLADHTTTKYVTDDYLINPEVPPVMSLDNNGEIAFALGYQPWADGVASSPARINAGLVRYWDLRATTKSYPVAVSSAAPGWGRMEATGYRVYLTPEDAQQVIQDAHDAHAADAALESFTSI